jgi:hypothetical protein
MNRTSSANASQEYDVFISYATEDRDGFVRPLVQALEERGLHVWYDEFELKVGDSLRQSIDRGLASSRFGIVVLSRSFLRKNWPQYELNGMVAKEIEGQKVVLPIWHGIDKKELLAYSPTLADKVALSTLSMTIEEVAENIASVLRQS